MTETRRIQLHLGKCIDDLDKLHTVSDLNTKKAKLLCKSAQKLFDSAEQSMNQGDEESAYVFYMKYLRIVSYLSKRPEYLRDKKFYSNMVGLQNPGKAIEAAEKLKSSLINRYATEIKTKRIIDMQENEFNHKIEERKKVELIEVPQSLLPDIDEVTITSQQLFNILNCDKMKVMILDARPGKDFIASHIKHPACISVPEESISPGQSASVLEQCLPKESRIVWAERASMDVIVMLDWSSKTVIPGKTLHLLKTILLKWDVKVQYPRPPLALLGGYDDWLLRYPMKSTNPHVIAPITQEHMDHMLESIDYPNWTDLNSPTVPVSILKNMNNEPLVDRSSKQVAVQIYEERAKQMQNILEKQEQLMDNSLNLEMQRIGYEQDWEKLSKQRELEQQEELQAMYQLKEQEIISQLMQLENKQYDMEQENQSLREQLEEYQRKEREEARLAEDSSSRQFDMCAKRARIQQFEQQRQALDMAREKLEQQRKRKLSEARANKKPSLKDDDSDQYAMSSSESHESMSVTRSLSSPNIAKVSAMEEEDAQGPWFDRSTKPIRQHQIRNRDLQPVFADVDRGLTGLKNLGNTCYMNSIIQCLNNTAILATYFCSGQYMDHINRNNGTRGAIAEELAVVVRALWSSQYKFIAAKDFRNEVGKHQRSFRGCEQQDSHEFLTILMDWLHDDLQFDIKAPNKESLPPSEKAWHEYTKLKESLILRLFYGQIKSTVRCLECSFQSATYESFSNLSLELPTTANRCTLADCMKSYLKGETVPGWDCPKCKEKRDAVKKLDISRLPPVLVIHFKRFYLDSKEYMLNSYRKKQTFIDFPLDDLDMRQFAIQSQGNSLYSLYAVSNHYGSMEGGHYTAYCKSSVNRKWYKYDDHVVTEISPSEVKSSAAYILFYTSCRQ